jgi:hypothetical protein
MKRELIEIGSTIRVENGPARKVAIATEELLNNERTARHYHVGAFDAMGERIVLNKPMTYLDYKGEWVWYVYQYDKIEERWLPVGVEKSKEAAMAIAKKKARSWRWPWQKKGD